MANQKERSNDQKKDRQPEKNQQPMGGPSKPDSDDEQDKQATE
jgi:hypothetical protein